MDIGGSKTTTYIYEERINRDGYECPSSAHHARLLLSTRFFFYLKLLYFVSSMMKAYSKVRLNHTPVFTLSTTRNIKVGKKVFLFFSNPLP